MFEHGDVRVRQYWDVPMIDRSRPRIRPTSTQPARVVARFSGLLEESVRLRLMSDVPLGVFLSGGIDSSAVAALMARQIGSAAPDLFRGIRRARLQRARIRPRGRQGGRRRGSHEVVISDREFFDALPTLLWHEDEPIAHPSSVPLYFVSALARRHVKVVLTGEGSDELLAGYGKYSALPGNWRAGLRLRTAGPARVRRAIARGWCRGCRAGWATALRRSCLAMDAIAGIDVLRQLRGGPPRRSADAARTDLRLAATRENAYGTSLAHYRRPNGHSTLLDRCCTRTSRRIWSNCS